MINFEEMRLYTCKFLARIFLHKAALNARERPSNAAVFRIGSNVVGDCWRGGQFFFLFKKK